jgi:hypothetical protein
METQEITIFDIEELSEESQEKAYTDWLQNFEYFHNEDNEASLKAFADVFPIKVKDYSYGYCNSFINFELIYDTIQGNDIREFKGLRLLKHIVNNYWNDLFEGKKYYGKEYKKFRQSRIHFEQKMLTGFYLDYDLMQPIIDFLKNPSEHTDIEDIMNDCLQAWLSACNSDYEACQSMEYFKDTSEANGWQYYESGRFFYK